MSYEYPSSAVSQHSVDQMLQEGRETERRIRAYVAEIRSGIVGQSGVSDETLTQTVEDGARSLWASIKEERIALYAVLLGNEWQTFKKYSAASPSRVTEFWNRNTKFVLPEYFAQSDNPLLAIAASVRNMTFGVIDQWRRDRESHSKDSTDPLHLAYLRSELMCKFANEHQIHGMDTAGVLGHGFSGVQQVAYGISEAIPKTFAGVITAEEYAERLRNSYANFFVRPAHLDQSVGIPLMNAAFSDLRHDRGGMLLMDPSALATNGTRLRLKNEPVFSQASEAMSTQAGCPALYAMDEETGQSVNREFFQFYVGLVEEHHISRYPRTTAN